MIFSRKCDIIFAKMNSVYLKLYEKNRAFLTSRPKIKKCVYLADKLCTVVVVGAYAFLCAYALFIARFSSLADCLRLFGLPAICLALTSILRRAINEQRPYECGIEPLFIKTRRGQSFPSRHLSCAAVIAGVSFYYLLPCGIVCAACAAVLFYTRFACGWHFPRDLICGLLLGAACALPAFLI